MVHRIYPLPEFLYCSTKTVRKSNSFVFSVSSGLRSHQITDMAILYSVGQAGFRRRLPRANDCTRFHVRVGLAQARPNYDVIKIVHVH